MSNLTPDILYNWPLVIILYDCFVPETAWVIVEGLKGVDDETFAVGMKVFAMKATEQVNEN